MRKQFIFGLCVLSTLPLLAVTVPADERPESIDIWPGLAPGEQTKQRGEQMPRRPQEKPPVTRVIKISYPTLEVFRPDEKRANGVGVLILPGGGFGKVVPDMEGSEAARWLNQLGITAFVLSYRTRNNNEKSELWKRPLQDSQRALRYIRAHADHWDLKSDQVGLLGFSAGGQVAAIHSTTSDAAYEPIDAVDGISFRCRAGEVFGLLGPNGAGKTTLLHTLAGLRAPRAGQVQLDGRPLGDLSRREVARRLGLVFQERSDRAVHGTDQRTVGTLDVVMTIPVAGECLHKSDALLDQSTGQ